VREYLREQNNGQAKRESEERWNLEEVKAVAAQGKDKSFF